MTITLPFSELKAYLWESKRREPDAVFPTSGTFVCVPHFGGDILVHDADGTIITWFPYAEDAAPAAITAWLQEIQAHAVPLGVPVSFKWERVDFTYHPPGNIGGGWRVEIS